jgi:hypothetical protein
MLIEIHLLIFLLAFSHNILLPEPIKLIFVNAPLVGPLISYRLWGILLGTFILPISLQIVVNIVIWHCIPTILDFNITLMLLNLLMLIFSMRVRC